MNRLHITDLPLPGLKLVERQRLGDARGYFSRLFCARELAECGWDKPIAQINFSHTAQCGTVRGLHYQLPPHAEKKLVQCLRGRIWDVAVDIRRGSSTFLHWHAETLSAENGRALLVPEGFAHGFQTLSDDVDLLYLHSEAYVPASEGGLHVNDPRLAIAWPLPMAALSDRDAGLPAASPDFGGIA
ncbi:MAG: dTDP-4-dehydrorhamnose 3,5-epimerase [Desulfobulbus sp.]|nr:dTDP-4-dehydrorhamnose 3,5-epimerase [Desulfobulbus sp.]